MQSLSTPMLSSSATQVEATSHAEAFPKLAVIVLWSVFFLTDHSFDTSKLDAFTQTAEEMEVTAMGGNSIRQLAFLSLAAFGIYNLVRPGRQRFQPAKPALFLIGALLCWCGLSVLWTSDVDMTTRRLIVLGCCVCGVAGIVKQYSPRQLMLIAMTVCAGFLVLGIGTEIVVGTFRPWGSDYRFSGTLHPNTQSLNVAALCLSSFCLSRSEPKYRGRLLVLFGVALLFLILTKSRTAAGGVVFALGFIWLASTSWRTKVLTAFAGIWFGASAGLFLLFASSDAGGVVTEVALLGRNEQAGSLSERVPLWTELRHYVDQRPLQGYGFDSFWKTDRIEKIADEMEWGIREAHCSYLEAILTIGLIGLGLLVSAVIYGVVISTMRYLKTGDMAYAFITGLLLFGMFDGMMESGMVSPIFSTCLAAAALLQAICYARSSTSKVVTSAPAPAGV